ncbi:MAG: 4Fe-4S [Actinobacteria bacterium]|nr:MAG: 4Fe-4S [Actinomycetota bacterium]MDO8949449.1 EFR1 family ferrodoxin [Actinomycetota bacterium]
MTRPARLLISLRLVSAIVVAIPAVGLGAATFWQGLAEPGGMSLDRMFHLSLGLALFVLFAEFAVSIIRSRASATIIALGLGGFLAAALAAIVAELLGPPALLILVIAVSVWAVVLARTTLEGGDAGSEVQPRQLELHYFTGTGNTYRVASWIAAAAKRRGIESALVRIDTRETDAVTGISDSADHRTLGILTPTHGFTAPWAVVAYAATVPGVRGADVFALATRAGWYVGPLRLPGFEGTAAWLLALILMLRGGRLVGVAAIDMPSNWTALHPGMNAGHIATIVEKAQAKTDVFAGRLLSDQIRLGGLLELAGGLVLIPVSLGYVVFARKLLGKLFFADERCTSCGLCARMCPLDAVRMSGSPPKRPYWTFGCESCMRCMNICPEEAIQASWVGAIAQTAVLLAATEYVAGIAVIVGVAKTSWVVSVLGAVILFALTGATYHVVWVLGRSRTVAWLLGHATPTRLYRRYREPGTDLRDV